MSYQNKTKENMDEDQDPRKDQASGTKDQGSVS
jgi:hypothetical protein